jgi:hypothetical protein
VNQPQLRKRSRVVACAGAVLLAGTLGWATAGRGTTTTVVSPSRLFPPFKVMRFDTGEWVKVEAKRGLRITTQTIAFQPGALSGWHGHPGPVFISVKEGTMTFYDTNCRATVISASDPVNGFLDAGDDSHLAVNESGLPATNVVTYFLPPDWPVTSAPRIDAPAPARCPIQ